MALVGGGGAPNVAGGGNPAGTGTSLNYIGDHAYAYSGVVSVDDNETSLIDATTGALYIVGQVTFSYPEFSSDNYRYRIHIDEQQVWGMEVGGGTDANLIDPVDVMIPPFSRVRITADNSASSSSVNQVAILVGRVYQ
jgi:hypothetical protein